MSATLEDVQLLRSREAAAALEISVRQLDNLVTRGVLSPVRLTEGGHRRFRLRDLAALVAATHKED